MIYISTPSPPDHLELEGTVPKAAEVPRVIMAVAMEMLGQIWEKHIEILYKWRFV